MTEFKQELKEAFDEDPLGTVAMLPGLAVIAFFLLMPEYIRYVACRLIGREYRSPTRRVVEDIEHEQ